MTVSTLREGALIGEASLVNDAYHSTFAEVTEPAMLVTLPGPIVRHLLQQRPMLGLGLVRAMTQRVQDVEARLEMMFARSVSARLAALLIYLAHERGPELEGISHETLADLVGTYRETVSKIMSDFRSVGYVRQVRRQHIVVLDSQGLTAVATV